MVWTVCSKNGSLQFILIWMSHQCQNLHRNISISSVRTETACLLFQAALQLIKRRCHFFLLEGLKTLISYTAVITPQEARSASETLPCTLQGTGCSAWPWCGCFRSTEPGSGSSGWVGVGTIPGESLFDIHRSGGRRWRSRATVRKRATGNPRKKRKKKHAFEKWAGEWSQEAKWGDGGEKTELGCSLVWQHHCYCLEGEREAGWHRDGASVRADLFLILSLSDHSLSPTFFIAFPLTSPV